MDTMLHERQGEWLKGYTRPAESLPSRAHSCVEVDIVLSGTGMGRLGASRVAMEPGQVYIVPQGSAHGLTEAGDLRVFTLLIHHLLLEKSRADLENSRGYYMLFTILPLLNELNREPEILRLERDQLAAILPLMDALESLEGAADPQAFMVKNHLGLSLILQLCRFYQRKDGSSSGQLDQEQRDFIEGIRRLFYFYNEKITVDQMAANVHMSKNTFIRHFEEIFHEAPGDFLVKYRLLKAKNQITGTDMPFSEVARLNGFYDTSHFVKLFKKWEGITPSEYRQRFQK